MINKIKAFILVLGLVCSSIPMPAWAAIGERSSDRNSGQVRASDHATAVPSSDLGLDAGYEIHDYTDLGPGEVALTRTTPEGSIDFVLGPSQNPNAAQNAYAMHVLAVRTPNGATSTSNEHASLLASRVSAEIQPVAHELIGARDLSARREILDKVFLNADKSGDVAGTAPALRLADAPAPASSALRPASHDLATPASVPQAKIGTVAPDAPNTPTAIGRLVQTVARAPKALTDAWEIYRQHQLLKAWEASPKRILVLVNSLSYPHDPGLVGGEFYDVRPLAQILFAKDPNLQLVYVTAMPISQSVIHHVLRGRSDADEILKRVHFISINDSGTENLAAKLVMPKHAEDVAKIKAVVDRLRSETGAPAASQFYMTDANAWKLTAAFGIPDAIFGFHPSLERWTGKYGNRKVMADVLSRFKTRSSKVRVRMADGEEGIFNVEQVVDAIDRVRARHPGLAKVAIKLEQGTSGGGNIFRDIARWGDPTMTHQDKIDQIESTLRDFTIGIADPKSFLELLGHEGAVVEEFVEDYSLPGVTFPSCQADIAPDGSIQIVSTHEQILKDRNVYMGVDYLAKPAYRGVLREVTQAMGRKLAQEGVIGRIAVDFAAVPRADGTYDVFVIEINVRLGGTTHPLIAAKELTDAYYDGKGELRRAGDNLPVRYRAMDHDVRANLAADVSRGLPGVGEDEFLAFFERPENRDILFNKSTRKGTVFHLLPAVRLSGNVGYTIIGTSKREVDGMQARLTELLDQLEIEHLTGQRGVTGDFVPHDARESARARDILSDARLEKAFEDFLSWNGDILYSRKTGKGVVFHPTGFTVIGADKAERDRLKAQMERLLASFEAELVRYDAEINEKKAALKPNQRLYRSSGGRLQTMHVLETSLKRMGLPPVEVKVVDQPVDPRRRTIAFPTLVSVWKVAIAEEVDRQSPGDYFLVLDPSDVILETEPSGFVQPYLTEGLHIDRNGKATIMKFKYPRPIDYGGNWLTLAAFGRDDGISLEKNDIPWSSSIQLEKIAGDKSYTRALIDEGVPQSVLFMMPKNQLLAPGALPHEPTRVSLTPMPATREGIREQVVEFLKRYHGKRVVVKPVSGMRFHSGEGVDFFDREEVDRITDHIFMLSKHPKMEDIGGILLDQCIDTLPIRLRFGDYAGTGHFAYWHGKKVGVHVLDASELATSKPSEKKDYNLRMYAARSPENGAVAVKAFVRAGGWAKPTNVQTIDPEDSAAVLSFEAVKEALVKQYGISPEKIDQAYAKMQATAENSLRKIMSDEARRALDKNGPSKAQTDFVSFDFMMEKDPVTGELEVYFIEINDHDSGGQWLADWFYEDGLHTRTWAQTMMHRADENVERRLAKQP